MFMTHWSINNVLMRKFFLTEPKNLYNLNHRYLVNNKH